MTNPNDPNRNPKDIANGAKDFGEGKIEDAKNLGNDRVNDLRGAKDADVDPAGTTRVQGTNAERTTATPARSTSGSTAVTEENNGGGWWKWLLGIIVALLLLWLLWSLFSDNDDEGTTETSTTTAATEVVSETTTVEDDAATESSAADENAADDTVTQTEIVDEVTDTLAPSEAPATN